MTDDFKSTFSQKEASNIAKTINAKLGDFGISVSAQTHSSGRFDKGPPPATLVIHQPSLRYSEYTSTLKSNRAYFTGILKVLQDEGILASASKETRVHHPLSGLNIFDEDPSPSRAFLVELKYPIDEQKLNNALDKAKERAEALVRSQEDATPLLAKLGIAAQPATHPNTGPSGGHYNSPARPMPGLLEVKLSGNIGYGCFNLNNEGAAQFATLKKLEEKGALTAENWMQDFYVHVHDIDKLREFCSQPPSLPDRSAKRGRA